MKPHVVSAGVSQLGAHACGELTAGLRGVRFNELACPRGVAERDADGTLRARVDATGHRFFTRPSRALRNALAQPGFSTCRPRASASASGDTSCVITEPVAT